MAKIDLQAFCDPTQSRFEHPFIFEGKVCAAAGPHVLRLNDPMELKVERMPPSNLKVLFDGAIGGVDDMVDLPEESSRMAKCCCPQCIEGLEHSELDPKCDLCKGSGVIDLKLYAAAPLGNYWISPKYIRLLRTLPGVKISTGLGTQRVGMVRPWYFTFDGGDGILMPCICAHELALDGEGGGS